MFGVLIVFFSWSFGAVMSVLIGRKCSCYFPTLLSSKLYYVVKKPQIQQLIIAPRRNRSHDTATAVEDRDKLAFIGCVYYIIDAIWIFIVYLLLFGLLICNLISEEILSTFILRIEDIFYFLFSANYFIFMGIMLLLYQIDYALGIYIHVR